MFRRAKKRVAESLQIIWNGSVFCQGKVARCMDGSMESDGFVANGVAYDSDSDRFLIARDGDWQAVSVGRAEEFLRESACGALAQWEPEACLVFVSDDGAMADYTKLGPLARDGVPFTLALTRDFLNGSMRSDALTISHVDEMAAWGCEVAAHGLTHRALTKLSADEMREEVEGSVAYLQQHGWTIKSFVYPFGACNTHARRLIWELGLSGCVAHGGLTNYDFDVTEIPRVGLGSFMRPHLKTAAQYKKLVDKAFRNMGLLVFMLHPEEAEYNATQQQALVEVVEHARRIGMRIASLGDAVALRRPLWQQMPHPLYQWILNRKGRLVRIWTCGSPGNALWSWLSKDSPLSGVVWKARGYIRRLIGRRGKYEWLSPRISQRDGRTLEDKQNPAERGEGVASFVRGFFVFLEARGIPAAALHNWQQGYHGPVSDVDFVVNATDFACICHLVHEYCKKVDWMLCQILRHETTAVYCVCASRQDTSLAVALDACSDYQHRGVCVRASEFLLQERLPLSWGGFRLSDDMELCYRFAKAAIKNKDVNWGSIEFATYSDDSRKACALWLAQKWGVVLPDWSCDGLRSALIAMQRRVKERRKYCLSPASVRRVVSRAFTPTGLVVVTGYTGSEGRTEGLTCRFGNLYFRQVRTANRWRQRFWIDLIMSTLVIVPCIPGFVSKLLLTDCVIVLDPAWDLEDCCVRIAKLLENRCANRELLT